MDKENTNISPEDSKWLDELLGISEEQASPEVGAAASEVEDLEKVVQNTLAEDWGISPQETLPDPFAQERAAVTPAPQTNSEDATMQFTPIEVEKTSMVEKKAKKAPAKKPANTAAKPSAPQKAPATQKKNRLPDSIRDMIPHFFSTLMWAALVVAIGVTLGRTLWVCAADILAFGKSDNVVMITVTEQDDIDDIARMLGEAKVVRYPNLFKLFATLTGKADDINPGTYTLNSKYDYNALAKIMAYTGHGWDDIEVVIPEGYNCAQTFALLEEKGVCSVRELEEWAANGELDDYWFLQGVPRGSRYSLEGYLFPDTYQFYIDDEPRRVLEKFLDNFDYRFTDKMKSDFEAMKKEYASRLSKRGYSSSYIAENGLTLHKLVTLASIVEEEKANNQEGYNIASVFYNRLTNPGSYPYLGSDATVYYAIGAYFERVELTAADLQTSSPYNTRNHKGLPPGPISNPGSYSLYAALTPTSTSYYYFIYDAKAGVHRFSKTLAEHNNWANKLGY